MASQFVFLQREWPPVFEAAARTELLVHRDPRAACFYARRANWPWRGCTNTTPR